MHVLLSLVSVSFEPFQAETASGGYYDVGEKLLGAIYTESRHEL